MGGFNKNLIGTAVIGGNGDSFVEEAVEFFYSDSFVVTAGGNMNVDVQDGADGVEEAFESATVVHNNESTETDFQQNVLDE